MLNLFKYIGLRHLQMKPGRAILTTLGVAFGIALYVAIAIINHSTKDAMRESIESIAGKAKMSIAAGPAGFDESKLEIIKNTAGVKHAVPMIEARAFFEGAKESTEGLSVLGVDLLQEQDVRTYKATDQRIIDDPLTFLNQPDSIIFTKSLAEKRGLKIDSKVRLATANGLKTFTVRGLLEPEGAAKAYGGSLAIMDIDGARMMFGKENKIDRVDIVPASGVSVETVRHNLEQSLGPGFTIETPEAQSEQTEAMLNSYQIVLTFFSSLALLVGLFLVMNSISVAVAERRKEIGTLRALGATRTSMVTLFVTEVVGIGLIGSILGCALGRVLADLLSKQVLTSVSAQFTMRIEVNHLEFTKEQIAWSILFGTVSSILAAFWPALKAAQVHPLESMKKHAENFSEKDEARANLTILAGLGCLLFMTVSTILHWEKINLLIDFATKASSILGAALFGPFLVFLLIRGFRKISSRSSTPVLRLAQENLVRSRRRTTSNVMALMVGLYLVMLIAAVRVSFHDTLVNWLDKIFVADLMVSSSGRMITADIEPMKEEIQNEILALPGIRPIGENRGTASRIVHIGYHGKNIAIKAIDRYADFYHFQNLDIRDSNIQETAKKLFESPKPVILVTPGFLEKQHVKVGDTIDVETPSGKAPFQIIGKILDYASPDGVFYMDRKYYKQFWKDPLVTAFVFSLQPGVTVDQIRTEIDQGPGRQWNLVTISNREFKDQMKETIERTFAYTKAVELIALLVGLLGLLNTLLISVLERTREIGMLRAVGTTRSQISKMILLEALLQGFFGAVIAIILGAYGGKMFIEYGLSTRLGWIIDFYFPTASVFYTLFTGVLVAMLAGILPSVRAANLNITEALDYE